MHLLHVETAVTDQLAGEQQHGDLVPVAPPGLGIGIHVEHPHGVAACGRQGGELLQQFLAQRAAAARIEHESRIGRRAHGRGDSAPESADLTEWAMNSTVWAGTSPTAVT